MKIAIDITEAVNGWRLDILEDGKKPYHENVTAHDDVLKHAIKYLQSKIMRPIHTMDVI